MTAITVEIVIMIMRIIKAIIITIMMIMIILWWWIIMNKSLPHFLNGGKCITTRGLQPSDSLGAAWGLSACACHLNRLYSGYGLLSFHACISTRLHPCMWLPSQSIVCVCHAQRALPRRPGSLHITFKQLLFSISATSTLSLLVLPSPLSPFLYLVSYQRLWL